LDVGSLYELSRRRDFFPEILVELLLAHKNACARLLGDKRLSGLPG
jgi:hypothetical protein